MIAVLLFVGGPLLAIALVNLASAFNLRSFR